MLVARGLVDLPQVTRRGGGPLRVDWSEGMLLHGPNLQNSTDLQSGLFSLGGNPTIWRRQFPGPVEVLKSWRLRSEGPCAAARLSTLEGMDRADAHIAIRSLGFEYNGMTAGLYVRYRHSDGSVIWIRPNGEVMRLGPKLPGQRYCPRYDPNGNVGHHPQGEFLPALPNAGR